MAEAFGDRRRSRPKRSGGVMAIILLLLLFSAWNTGENLLYIVLGGVASLLFLSAVLAGFNLRSLSLHREAPHAVFRGDPLLSRITLKNHKRWLPSISVRVGEEPRPAETLAYALKIAPGKSVLLDMEHVFERRGVYTLPACLLASSFPFGFHERRRVYRDAQEVLVYPRVSAVRIAALEQLPGGRMMPRHRTGDGDEYVSLREYLPGDDLRLIAWRISARIGVWMVRELGFGNVRSVIIFLDTVRDTGMNFEERFEDAVELAASLGVTLLSRQYSVGLHAGAVTVPLGRGSAQERKMLDLLARVEPEDRDGAAALIEQEARKLKSEPVRLVCISADPEKWGQESGPADIPVLDPGGLVHA